MKISIAESLRPFSHLPGTSTILPGCGYQVQIYPCLIRIFHLKNSLPTLLSEVNLELKGPLEEFTVCNDLEKGRITVFGKTSSGWLRYHVMSSKNSQEVYMFVDRTPSGGLSIYHHHDHRVLHANERMMITGNHPLFEPFQVPLCSRLSLGNHKHQDWDLIKRRLNLGEIFPLWHRLGQLVPSSNNGQKLNEGTLTLLDTCRKITQEGKPEKAEENWLNAFKGGFASMLTPRLKDEDFQGLIKDDEPLSSKNSPLVLLTEGAHLIQSLFFRKENDTLHFLPFLLPCFSFGRLIDIPLEGVGMLSFEWSKKNIRRLILFAEKDQKLTLEFRSDVRTYRLREDKNDKGGRKKNHSSLPLKKNSHYLFDNFE